MPDDPNPQKPLDSLKINVDKEDELEWWSLHLKINKEKLIEAINAVGISVKAVRKYLKI